MAEPTPPTIKPCAYLRAPKGPTIVKPKIVTAEDVCYAYFARKQALKTAILNEFKKLYRECNPEKGKLSLLAFEDGTWEVVQAGSTSSIRHPIDICDDPRLMSQKLWRQRLASQCDTWLHDQAMNSCTHQEQRDEVYNIIRGSTPIIVSLLPSEEEEEEEDEVKEKETEISATMGNREDKEGRNEE